MPTPQFTRTHGAAVASKWASVHAMSGTHTTYARYRMLATRMGPIRCCLERTPAPEEAAADSAAAAGGTARWTLSDIAGGGW